METDGIVTNTVQATVLQTTLDEISTHRGRGNAASDERCCVICLDAVSEDCVAQPCAHRNFDFVCLANWLEQKPNCPLCNAGIKEVQYGFSNDGKAWKTYTTSGPSTTEQSEAASRYSAPQPPRPRRRREYRPAREFSADEALSRRRHVYRHQLYSLHVGSNRHSSYQDLSPRLFEQRPDLVSRARAWIRRELRVFEFLSPREDSDDSTVRRRANNSEFLLEYIIAILKTVDMQDSCGEAEDMIQGFLGRDNTKLFLHELRSYLRSPHASPEAWDRNVQYRPRARAPKGR